MFIKKSIAILAICCSFSLSLYSQGNTKSLDYKKTIDTADCTKCNHEKKYKFCFIVSSYVDGIQLFDSKGKNIKPTIKFPKSSLGKAESLYYCTVDKYQEIKAFADGFAETIFALTPEDFKKGTPMVILFEKGKELESLAKSKTLFEKMAELEAKELLGDNESKETLPSETERLFTQKTYDTSKTDYCFHEGPSYRPLLINTGLKGTALHDKKERLNHIKRIKIKDTIQQYIYCVKPTGYKQYIFSSQNYKDEVVEIIPNDFRDNRTPVLTFYDASQRAFFEESEQKRAKHLYTVKSETRWDCTDCEKGITNASCILIHSNLSDLVLNDEKMVILPKAVKDVAAISLKQYTFCVKPDTKIFMVSKEGYQPRLLKVKFEDLETIGATVFVVVDKEADLNSILKLIEEEKAAADAAKLKLAEQAEEIKEEVLDGLILKEIPKQPLQNEITKEGPVKSVQKEVAETQPIQKEAIRKESIKAQPVNNEPVANKEYRVQFVAKLKNDVDAQKIQKMYNLQMEIKEDYDGRWYRYTVGSYTNPEEAINVKRDFRRKDKTKDAFIVLYIDGKRIMPFHHK